MSEFKEGEEIWEFWISSEGYSHSFVAENLNIDCAAIVKKEKVDFYNNSSYWKQRYKSKNEAIDAMISRLQGMKDESNN